MLAMKHSYETLRCEVTRESVVGGPCGLYRELHRRDGLPPDAEAIKMMDRWRELEAYHAAMHKKYRLAMWMPWVLMMPDPPLPTEPSWCEFNLLIARQDENGLLK